MSGDVRPAPLPRSWWVDEHVIAGAYPGAPTIDEAREKVAKLVDAGVTLFLDLTTPHDGLEPYELLLEGRARRVAVPVPDLTAPADDVVEHALGILDAEAERGGVAYVHCWGGIGRTGSIVGCYLARHVGGEEALERLVQLRVRSADARRRAPETEEQLALVRRWAQREGG